MAAQMSADTIKPPILMLQAIPARSHTINRTTAIMTRVLIELPSICD
jgi:hypothetical protein